jgi:hypothetical protein
MSIPMPSAGIGKTHGVGVVEIENRALAVWRRIRRRHWPTIVRLRSSRRLRPVRPIGPIPPIYLILNIVFIVAISARPIYPLVRQVHLAAVGGNLPSVNGAPVGTRYRIHPSAIIIGGLIIKGCPPR